MNAVHQARTRSLLVAAALVTASVAPAALAQSAPIREDAAAEAERLGEEGRVLYEAGRYAEAVGRYLRAWHLTRTSDLLYNVAYIYEKKLGERELALEYYRRYAKADDADPEVLTRALARIDALKSELDAEKTPGGGGDTEHGGGGTGPGGGGAGPGGPPPGGGQGPGDLHGGTGPGSGGSATPWVVIGAGAALTAGGLIMGGVAQGTLADFEASTNLEDKKDLRGQGESQALWADVLMGVGLATVATGIVMRILEPAPEVSAATGTPRFELQAGPIAGGGLLGLRGSF